MAGLHNGKVMAGLMLCVFMTAGCGVAKVPDNVEANSLIIDKEGAVTVHIVDVFDKDYYNLEGLRKMAQSEASSYNTANQTGSETPVKLERVEALPGGDNAVVVTYVYDGAETYADYSGNAFFYGTVAEAQQAGYDFGKISQVLYDTKGKNSIVSSKLDEMSKKHVVLLEEKTRVYCPYKVAYTSEAAKVMEDGSIDTAWVTPEEYPVIIVLDK